VVAKFGAAPPGPGGVLFGRKTCRNLSIWAVEPPKSCPRVMRASPAPCQPVRTRHRHARHAV